MSVNFGSPFQQPSFGNHPTTILNGPGNTVQYTALPGGFKLSSVNTPVQQPIQNGVAGGATAQQQPFQTGFGAGFFQQPALQQLGSQQGIQQPTPQFQNRPLYQQPYQPQPVNSGFQDVMGMVLNLMGSLINSMTGLLANPSGEPQSPENGQNQTQGNQEAAEPDNVNKPDDAQQGQHLHLHKHYHHYSTRAPHEGHNNLRTPSGQRHRFHCMQFDA